MFLFQKIMLSISSTSRSIILLLFFYKIKKSKILYSENNRIKRSFKLLNTFIVNNSDSSQYNNDGHKEKTQR